MSLQFSPLPHVAPAGGVDAAWAGQAGRAFPPPASGALLAQGTAVAARQALLEGARAVTTGQQAGLFGGPLYTIFKALTASALAEAIAKRQGAPVVPVFWVAGDDHDFAEISQATVLGPDGRPATVTLRERDGTAAMLPVFREPVGDTGQAALAALRAALPPGDLAGAMCDRVEAAYQPGLSLAEAHARLLADLLAPYGVVVVRGWDGDLKRAAREVLLGAARRAEEIDRALAADADRLRLMGKNVPVPVGEGMSLLMLEGSLGRDRLRLDGPGFALRRSGEQADLESLGAILDRDPERISANVLLRPAVEASVIPSVAYVGGPGELAYLEQTGPVFTLLGVPRPARVARLSGFLIEEKVQKILAKYSLEPADLGMNEGELASRIARQEMPTAAASAFAAAREAVTNSYAALQTQMVAVDATLEKTAAGARNQSLVALAELEKKLVSALKRNSETTMLQVSRARDQLYPTGHSQERVLSVISFMARHGEAVLDLVLAAARRHAQLLLEATPGEA